MSQRDASRKRRKARPAGSGKAAAERTSAAAEAVRASAEAAARGGVEPEPPSEKRKRDAPPPVARAKRTPVERKAARTADKAARDAHRKAAALATAGGPIAPGLAFEDDDDAPPPLTRAEKTEAKNEAVRERLEPLGPGERPEWVTYGAVLAVGLGILNVILYGVGVRVQHATFGSAVLIGWVLVACGAGMWRAWYPAVLAFEVLVGVTGVFGALSLLVASSIPGALRSIVVAGVSFTFFWKLIRAMARLQMPGREAAGRSR